MEKINIYVPANVGKMLKKDALMFEVYKTDRCTINKNRFLNMLIKGYYNDYFNEARNSYEKIISSINTDKLSLQEKEIIAKSILESVVLPMVPSRKGKNPERLSLKPTKDTESLIEQIMGNIGGNEYISQYFCKMLISYCNKPFSLRENIIFKNSFEIIQRACDEKKSIIFKTIWNEKNIHEVIPYKIVTGSEEMFNYLLCVEDNPETGEQETRSYRLNRIDKINYGSSMKYINDSVKQYLDMMVEYGPQFMINEDIESCIRLNSDGIKMYNRIYYGRPKFERIETKDNVDYYFFRCSLDQLYIFFRRFEGNAAEVIYPDSLRKKMVNFFEESLKNYRK